MKKTLSMSDIQDLIDQKYNYGTDEDIAAYMKDISPENRHLVDRRTVLRYFQYYATSHKVSDYTQVIHPIGKGTKGTSYDVKEIRKLLSDPGIKQRIDELYNKKTQPGPFGPVPKCIWSRYYKDHCEENVDWNAVQASGYSKRQETLWGILTEDLLQIRDDIYSKINDITKQIRALDEQIKTLKTERDSLQEEADEIEEELNRRRKYDGETF